MAVLVTEDRSRKNRAFTAGFPQQEVLAKSIFCGDCWAAREAFVPLQFTRNRGLPSSVVHQNELRGRSPQELKAPAS